MLCLCHVRSSLLCSVSHDSFVAGQDEKWLLINSISSAVKRRGGRKKGGTRKKLREKETSEAYARAVDGHCNILQVLCHYLLVKFLASAVQNKLFAKLGLSLILIINCEHNFTEVSGKEEYSNATPR